MASEYLKWKYRDVQPDAPIELTSAQKRANWWHYHKWQVILGAVLLLCLGDILVHALGIGQVQPDVQIAYVGSAALPEETAAALETALASLATDGNGDGKVVVQLNQYAAQQDGSAASSAVNQDSGERAFYAEAAQAGLIADLERCDSFLFLLEDGETFQRGYQILAHTDGTLPSEMEAPSDRLWLNWTDCPVLAGLDLGSYTETVAGTNLSGDSQTLLSRLKLARRGFWTGTTCKNPETCEELWNTVTKGAKS